MTATWVRNFSVWDRDPAGGWVSNWIVQGASLEEALDKFMETLEEEASLEGWRAPHIWIQDSEDPERKFHWVEVTIDWDPTAFYAIRETISASST